MNDTDIRAKAAELSVMMAAHVTAAIVIHHGIGGTGLSEMTPLALAPEIEEYIRTGKLPKSIPVTKLEKK